MRTVGEWAVHMSSAWSAAITFAWFGQLLWQARVAVERDWLLAEADDETRERFFRARQSERERREAGGEP